MPPDAAGAFAAYITGNVASNLIGRLVSAALADHLGLAANFYFFALLNLAGAVLVYFTVHRAPPMHPTAGARPRRDLGGPPGQQAAAGRLRHRLLHPVRLHRHVHLRELCPDRPAFGAEPHAAWIRLTSSSSPRSSQRRSPVAS